MWPTRCSSTWRGSVRAALSDTGALRELAFWLDERQTCATTGDRLPHYPSASCADVTEATVQLGINTGAEGPLEFTDQGLNVYFEPRDPGAERNVVRLMQLTPR